MARIVALGALVLGLWVAPSALAQVLTPARVALRDGTELSADVWTAPGPVTARATLLRRTPYGRAFPAESVAGIVGAGYNFVSVDVRGRGDSAGEFLPFVNDAEDGYDTIEWVAAQPWSNGRVGTYGGSAEGIVQLLAAGEAPPHLSCAHVTVATGDIHEALYLGGAWRTELGTAWMTGLGELPALAETRRHEARDAFWEGAILDDSEIAAVDVPILHIGGTFDIFSLGTSRTFASMAAHSAAGSDQFMVLGPWTHGGSGTATQGEVTFPADAMYSAVVEELVAFFGWCLGDGPRPDWDAARYYVMRLGDDGRTATGDWRSAPAWPPASTRAQLFLHDDGTLSLSAPAAAGGSAELRSDPGAPIASVGGGNLTTAAGPFDQAAIDRGDEVILAETPALASDVEVIGEVSATVFASSASTDGDVVVRLEEVTPSGRVIMLADGIRRGRFRDGRERAAPMTPGEPARFEVELGSVAFVLSAGHALRVAIQATSSPRFEPNPGTSDPIATATPVATTLTLYRDTAHPSALSLPVTSGAFPGAAPADADAAATSDAGAGARDAGSAAGPVAGCGCRAGAGGTPGAATLALVFLLGRSLGRRRRRVSGAHG